MPSKEAIKKGSQRQTRKVKVFRSKAQEFGFQLRPTWIRKSYAEALQEISETNVHFNAETVLDDALRFWFENSPEGRSLSPEKGMTSDIECFFKLSN